MAKAKTTLKRDEGAFPVGPGEEVPEPEPLINTTGAVETDEEPWEAGIFAEGEPDVVLATGAPEPELKPRPSVDGLVALTPEDQILANVAVVGYKPYPQTPLTAENLEERRQAALKVSADAAHLAFVLGQIAKGHAEAQAALNEKLAEEQAEIREAEAEAQAKNEEAIRQAKLDELDEREAALEAERKALDD